MYAGATDSAWSQGLWPHMSGLSPRFCADGLCTNNYQITNIGDSLAIGTFVHETGHLLFGWPDLYDYDGSSYGSVASYGLMAYGAATSTTKTNPVPPVAPLRELVGWETVTEINPAVSTSAPSGQLSSTSGSHQVYKWTNPDNTNEAFYIEAVYKSGQNAQQRGSGLLIYHVDTDGARDNEWHPYIQLEHADGNRDPENSANYGDDTDPYGQYGEFNATLPNALTDKGTNSLWWDGNDSGLDISDISQPAETITFQLNSTNENSDSDDSSETDGSDNTGTVYSGTLGDREQAVEPDGSYFYTEANTVSGMLSGPSDADFGLTLFKWVDGAWKVVGQSRTSGTSQEAVSYEGGAGYYCFVVNSESGSGSYQLTISQQ